MIYFQNIGLLLTKTDCPLKEVETPFEELSSVLGIGNLLLLELKPQNILVQALPIPKNPRLLHPFDPSLLLVVQKIDLLVLNLIAGYMGL